MAGVSLLGVIGSGQMGSGIAQVAALVAKVPRVLLVDKDQSRIQKSMEFMDKLLLKDVAKNKITEQDRKDVKSRISTSTRLEDLKEADFVIEAVNEDVSLKHSIFKELTKITPPSTILASNTSSISISKIGSVTNRPDKVIGMHFMNPVPVMKLVEIIPSLATSEDTLQKTLHLSKMMGKTTTKSADMPGFIANRSVIQSFFEDSPPL
eukprot:TRINITY_DN2858_c0_g1_i3.p1 TRINITY_DN2858_c0_g1~~TRINITY_DN2858_c0_g1_i3.p1  ORF type:complete len:208 (+),score=64.41 TRINITY_DN2858_c0_g1_i3:44-667(+)